MNKPVIISDSNKKSLKIKSFLVRNLKILSSKSKVVIVIGGDGFMLKTLKKNKNKDKKFYGINSGNYGFLMNKFSKKNLFNNIKESKMISISPLQMIVKNKTNSRKFLAINEVSILRQSRQAANLSIKHNSKFIK